MASHMSSLVLALLVSGGAGRQQPPAHQAAPVPVPAAPTPLGIAVSEAARISPYAPVNVTFEVVKGEPTVKWDRSKLQSVNRYRVYRKIGEQKFVRIAETVDTSFADKKAEKDATYSVTAVNVYGAESSFAKAVARKDR